MKKMLFFMVVTYAAYAADATVVKASGHEKDQKMLVYKFLNVHLDLSECPSRDEAKEALRLEQQSLANLFELFQRSDDILEIAHGCGVFTAQSVYRAFPADKWRLFKHLDWFVQKIKRDPEESEPVFETIYLKKIYEKKQILFIDEETFNKFYVQYGKHELKKIEKRSTLQEMKDKKQICLASARGRKSEMMRLLGFQGEISDVDSSSSSSDSE